MSNFGKKCSSPAPGLCELINSLIELVSILYSPPLFWIHRYDMFTCTRATKAHHKMCLPPTWSHMPTSVRANPWNTISFHSCRLLTKVQQAYTVTEIKVCLECDQTRYIWKFENIFEYLPRHHLWAKVCGNFKLELLLNRPLILSKS